MEALNALQTQNNPLIWAEGYYILTNILEPIIPHLCWEISENLFNKVNFDKPLSIKEEVFVQDSMVLAVTINGKKRCEIEVAKDLSQEEILTTAKEHAQKYIEGKEIIKEILVPNKLVNIVIKG